MLGAGELGYYSMQSFAKTNMSSNDLCSTVSGRCRFGFCTLNAVLTCKTIIDITGTKQAVNVTQTIHVYIH